MFLKSYTVMFYVDIFLNPEILYLYIHVSTIYFFHDNASVLFSVIIFEFYL